MSSMLIEKARTVLIFHIFVLKSYGDTNWLLYNFGHIADCEIWKVASDVSNYLNHVSLWLIKLETLKKISISSGKMEK